MVLQLFSRDRASLGKQQARCPWIALDLRPKSKAPHPPDLLPHIDFFMLSGGTSLLGLCLPRPHFSFGSLSFFFLLPLALASADSEGVPLMIVVGGRRGSPELVREREEVVVLDGPVVWVELDVLRSRKGETGVTEIGGGGVGGALASRCRERWK